MAELDIETKSTLKSLLSKNYRCKICNEILLFPLSFNVFQCTITKIGKKPSCNYRVCLFCARNYLNLKKNPGTRGNVPCPNCHKNEIDCGSIVENAETYTFDKAMMGTISDIAQKIGMIFTCSCGWSTYDQTIYLYEHLLGSIEKRCPNCNIPCQYCKKLIVKKDIINHYRKCKLYKDKCELCDYRKIEKDDISILKHMEICPNVTITCPYEEKIKIKHSEVILQCEHCIGCKRKDLLDHYLYHINHNKSLIERLDKEKGKLLKEISILEAHLMPTCVKEPQQESQEESFDIDKLMEERPSNTNYIIVGQDEPHIPEPTVYAGLGRLNYTVTSNTEELRPEWIAIYNDMVSQQRNQIPERIIYANEPSRAIFSDSSGVANQTLSVTPQPEGEHPEGSHADLTVSHTISNVMRVTNGIPFRTDYAE